MEGLVKIVSLVIIGLLLICFFAVFTGLPLMLLWNWLMPGLFNLPRINFFQAIGLGLIVGILFGGSRIKFEN